MSDALPSTGGPSTPPPSDFLIVGLGGSAGAISAFREFFRNVPPDSGMAYVVILHLSPEHESKLAEVLQMAAKIPVTQVMKTTAVQPDHVYVIPPNKSLAMRDGMLELSDITGYEERRAPVDIFFRTLADRHDSRAVCVIVSGTGADGSSGLRRIKEYNGLVLVQDPIEAEFGEMPRNSIATGLVDFTLPVAEMPRRIIRYRDQLRSGALVIAEDAEENERALLDIFTHLRMRTGHDFTNYKRATVLRRIERRLAVCGSAVLPEYSKYVRHTPEEAGALLRELLISVTNFFRDRNVWDKLEQTILPNILEAKGGGDQVRVWVAGCATGEEAYSVAMILAEAASHLSRAPEIQIFATDIDEEALAKARNAYFTAAEVADISPDQLRRYFVREKDGYRVQRELRELVLFAQHNLIKDPPFSHLDLISCRNLLIYLNRMAQQRAMEVLHFALEPGGYLLLGTAETVDMASQQFATIDKESHIYQSRAVAPKVNALTPPPMLPVTTDLRASIFPHAETRAPRPARFAPNDLHQRLLEEYAPPSLIIDDQHTIVHLSERAGRYLQIPGGEASLDLLQVIRPDLRIDLRTALYQAAQKRMTVAARGVPVGSETINVIVRPVLGEADPARGYFLVIFEEAANSLEIERRAPAAVEPASRELEEELIRVKSQMRSTIEQYELQAEEAKAANEELQAMNEELRSMAEELETSQEELRSVNEELQTVNQELKVKVDEISHANNDIRNLMSSTEIGTIFVDRSLRVKLFTPRVRDIFNLIPADIGRPLPDITNRLDSSDLNADVEHVLERLHTLEREVQSRDGRWHLMRMLPYRTGEDRIEGVVVTFLDITGRKHTEQALQQSRDELERRVMERTAELHETTAALQAIVDASPIAIVSVDHQHRIRTWNPSAERMLGRKANTVLGKTLEETAANGLSEILLAAMKSPEASVPRETDLRRSDGTVLSAIVFPAPLLMDGHVVAVMGLLQDITERKRFEREREQLLRRIVSSQEEKRQRIARELHDQLGQHLTALKVGLETLPPAGSEVQLLKNIVSDLDRSVDGLALELRPPVLDDVGLYGAIGSLVEQFAHASGVRVDVHAGGTEGERLPAEVETALYRILQEALTNVWKHADAKTVSVIVERNPELLQLIVEDDGKGFEQGDGDDGIRGALGLLGMRERVALIGGTFHVEAEEGRGTTVYIRVPLGGGKESLP